MKGLDEFARRIRELEKAVAELDGDIARVSFDPYDPESIDQAIHKLNSAVEERIARYAHNDMVAAIADEVKENGRNAILERAAAARMNDEGEEN